MADHERLFQKDDAEKCVPGYVILCENQTCRRRSLRTRTQCELTLDALREKSRNTVYTLSELREDVRTMIRKKIDSSDDHSYTRRKSKLLDRIGTFFFEETKTFFSRVPAFHSNLSPLPQPMNCSKKSPSRILSYLVYSSVLFALNCLRRKRK